MKRLQSITLFITIALLLTAKAGFTYWQSNTDALQPSASAQISPEPDKQVTLKSPADDMTASRHPIKQAEHLHAQHSPTNVSDSWAMLEAYLIPEAGAASAPQQATPAIEDKTLTSLRSIREKLNQRSRKLDQRASALQQAEKVLKQRITELQQLEASIQQRLSAESKIKNKKIKRLTGVFASMKPQQAAPVIAKMDLATVIRIFLLMDEKKVGKILSFLPPDQAVAISQALTRQISSVK